MAHLYFAGTTEKDALSYTVGEEIVFRVQLTADGSTPVPCAKIRYRIRPDGGEETSGELPGDSGLAQIRTCLHVPGFVFVDLTALGEIGEPLEDCDPYNGGAGADIGAIRAAYDEPKDFTEFWERIIREEANPVAPVFLKYEPVPSPDDAFDVYDIHVAAPGPRPATASLCIPKNAAPASLPISINYNGYGVSNAKPVLRSGMISINVSQHGTENFREDDYYQTFNREHCTGFGFDPSRNADHETCDFKYMLLRDLQVLRAAKTCPEWNGHVIVSGGSMGAFQATFIAAFGGDADKLEIVIPWMCDLFGVKIGRTPGWRPDPMPGMMYYDTVNFMRLVSCPVTISANLGDDVCPPSGILSLYHAIRGQKELCFHQDCTHGRGGRASVSYPVQL